MKTADITKDSNHVAYLELLARGELRPYEGTYIAIVSGELVDNDLKRDAVLARVREQFKTEPIYVRKINGNNAQAPDNEVMVVSIDDIN